MYFDVKFEISCLMIFIFCIYSLSSIIIIIIIIMAQVGAETNLRLRNIFIKVC
jgi:hypothetical protein